MSDLFDNPALVPGSVEWYAERQAELRANGQASAAAFHESRRVAKEKAQEGIEQAVSHAEKEKPGWSANAYEFIRLHCIRNKGKRFTGFEVVQASIAYGLDQPPNPRAWGGPLQKAARNRLIVRVGTVADPNPERHGSDVPLWEAA